MRERSEREVERGKRRRRLSPRNRDSIKLKPLRTDYNKRNKMFKMNEVEVPLPKIWISVGMTTDKHQTQTSLTTPINNTLILSNAISKHLHLNKVRNYMHAWLH